MADVIPFPVSHLMTAPPRRLRNEATPHATSTLQRWHERVVLRRMLRDDLLPQPDSVLADAGWTREAAWREAGKPFWRP